MQRIFLINLYTYSTFFFSGVLDVTSGHVDRQVTMVTDFRPQNVRSKEQKLQLLTIYIRGRQLVFVFVAVLDVTIFCFK